MRTNANGQSSEYSFQAEFVTIFKNLLLMAYADLKYRVLVEVRERDNGGNRHWRLDILVRDGPSLPAYGFKLVVTASKEDFKFTPSSITVWCTSSTCALNLD